MTAVVGALMLLFGVLLGLVGGGAGILTVPMLVYLAGIDPKAAIPVSLLSVGTTSLIGTLFQAHARRVRWEVGVLFSPAAATGAFVGGRLAHFVPGNALLAGLGLALLGAAFAMLLGRSESTPSARLSLLKMLPLGAGVGMFCSLVGAGGGFLVVPTLTLFGGLGMREAVGTSLFVITIQCFAGFLGHIGHAELDVALLGVMICTASIGVVAGTFLGRRVSSGTLKRTFGWLVLALGLFVVGKRLPLGWAAVVASITLGSALILTAKPVPPPRSRPRQPPQSFAACARS